ncbi:MAG: hypothetical protein ACRD0E_01720 [Acidimicrobiales bacterium]
MTLWWIGNAIALFVVLPVVIYLFDRILKAVERIRGAVDNILVDGVSLTGDLDDLPEVLSNTGNIVKEVAIGTVRYAGSVGKLLG